MTLDKQVVSLELARKLKELGVRQESAFYWRELSGECKLHKNYSVNMKRREWVYCFAAFTVSELGEMLPPTLGEPYDIEHFIYDNPRRYGVEANTYKNGIQQNHFSAIADTEADARAKMLIYLIEQKVVEVK